MSYHKCKCRIVDLNWEVWVVVDAYRCPFSMCPYMNGGSSLLRNDENLRCTTRTKICARKDRTRTMKTMIAVFVDSKMCRCILILMVRGDESLGLLEPMSDKCRNCPRI